MPSKGFTTRNLHSDREDQPEHGVLHKPVHPSVAFGYADARELAEVFQGKRKGYAYARQGNPTVVALQKRITDMEEGIGSVAFSTGMAAIAALTLTLLKAGDHLISSAHLFGNTNSYFRTLERLGIEVDFVDATSAAAVAEKIRGNTRLVFVETIANPVTQVADLEGIGELCRQHGLLYVVDNTMTSPHLFLPKSVGAGLVVNSLTKCIGGHGNALGGTVTDTGNFDWSAYPNIFDIYRKGDAGEWGLLQIRKKGLRDMGALACARSGSHPGHGIGIAFPAHGPGLRQCHDAGTAVRGSPGGCQGVLSGPAGTSAAPARTHAVSRLRRLVQHRPEIGYRLLRFSQQPRHSGLFEQSRRYPQSRHSGGAHDLFRNGPAAAQVHGSGRIDVAIFDRHRGSGGPCRGLQPGSRQELSMLALIAADDVLEGCSKEVEAGDEHFFLVRKDDQLHLYRNICPHLGTPLNWEEDRFLDPDGALIQCSTHGALFRIEDGFCLAGPCVGAHLHAVPFIVVDGMVMIEPARQPDSPAPI